jgi:thiosulfate reductase cytochrome b subunit
MSVRRLTLLFILPVGLLAALVVRQAAAQTAEPPAVPGSPVHPSLALLDAAGTSVLASGRPVSTLATCGQCHDIAYIQQHNSHSQATASTRPALGGGAGWDPILYRAEVASVSAEPNCFLCHLAAPDNAARLAALNAGQAAWANTATLAATGLVTETSAGWHWQAGAFDEDGTVARTTLGLQDPADANCAQCHGAVHTADAAPITLDNCSLDQPQTAATGQVYGASLIADSGLNLAGKESLTRPWDVHAERGLHCTDCHVAPNNPVHDSAGGGPVLEHLVFDPRRLELGEYVQRPNHDFSAAAQCTDCHAAEAVHDWLPYAAQHMAALACETCHVPRAYAPALQEVDWTVLTADVQPRTTCRGAAAGAASPAGLVSGYIPTLLRRASVGGGRALAPFNLITAWYWQYDDLGVIRPVELADLQAAYLNGAGGYAPEVITVFDASGNGTLDAGELVLDTPGKQAVIAGRLSALGLANPQITGTVRSFALNHTIATGGWAIGDCQVCHTGTSRLAEPLLLASTLPGGPLPALAGADNLNPAAGLHVRDGALYYAPATLASGRYVFGHDRAAWADWVGALAFLGVLAGVVAHGGLRVHAALRAPRRAPRARRVYMYAAYERFWHWLQTLSIVLLLGTGLIIHRPDLFAAFSFRHVVLVHNVLAAILAINAALALFYHLASGEVQQYLPRPHGFFDQAVVQARYYLRGLFRGEPHPFEKTTDRKLNPLQQVTYVGILNVLLPLQVITGALMWGTQQWPVLAAWLGGLPLLAPVHSLVAWLFGAFIVAHVYLTTTGLKPLAGLDAMINGWEDVELGVPAGVHAASPEVNEHEHPLPDSRASAASQAATPDGLAV